MGRRVGYRLMVQLSPVLMFVYNRLQHARLTIEALQKNELAKETDLYIFSDAPVGKDDIEAVSQVRSFIKNITGFKTVTIEEQSVNLGLAASIIAGVSKILDKSEQVIVLEDDIVCGRYFLKFMNDALEAYKDEDKVGSVSGYLFPLDGIKQNFFARNFSSWGWGTWRRAWQLFLQDGRELLRELDERQLAFKMDFDGTMGFSAILRDQIAGRNNSWAIRFFTSLYLRDKLTFYPKNSLIANIGCDGSGTHCGTTNINDVEVFEEPLEVIAQEVKENLFYRQKFINYFNFVNQGDHTQIKTDRYGLLLQQQKLRNELNEIRRQVNELKEIIILLHKRKKKSIPFYKRFFKDK